MAAEASGLDTVGGRIAAARRAAFIKSPSELARLITERGYSVTRQTIGNIERGTHIPRPDLMEQARGLRGVRSYVAQFSRVGDEDVSAAGDAPADHSAGIHGGRSQRCSTVLFGVSTHSCTLKTPSPLITVTPTTSPGLLPGSSQWWRTVITVNLLA